MAKLVILLILSLSWISCSVDNDGKPVGYDDASGPHKHDVRFKGGLHLDRSLKDLSKWIWHYDAMGSLWNNFGTGLQHILFETVGKQVYGNFGYYFYRTHHLTSRY